MFTWLYLGLLIVITLIWLWFNLSPTMRQNVTQRLEPTEPQGASLRSPATTFDPQSTAGLRLAARTDTHFPHVLILVPGRNEASFLPTTLVELCEQDYPNYTVAFIDDHSSDETPAITAKLTARYPHLFVLRNEIEPPLGWVGKCWAIKRGYEAWKSSRFNVQGSKLKGNALATNNSPDASPTPDTLNPTPDLICLTDADIHWHPACLRTAVEVMQREKADIVSLFPGMIFGSVVERVLMGTLTFALLALFPVSKAMDPAHPDTLTAGAFILTRRKLYDQIGGHESVRNQVVEDVNLGRKLKAAGGKVWIAFTQNLITCRMYEGWSDIWEGLTKNAYAGMEYKPHVAAGLLTANLFALTLTPIYVVISAIWLCLTGSAASIVATTLALAIVLLQARVMNGVRRNFALPLRYAFSLPLGAAIYLPIAIASIWRYYRGGNNWKGRSYGKATVEHDQACTK